jgi:hypothetical protein
MNEFVIFLKYLATPSGFIKELFTGIKELFHPKRLSIMFMFLGLFIGLIYPSRLVLAFFFLLLSLIMQFRLIYKAGDHNRWRNERLKNHARQVVVKKNKSDGSNEIYLETRNITGEEDKDEHMPVNVDNQPPAEEKNNE